MVGMEARIANSSRVPEHLPKLTRYQKFISGLLQAFFHGLNPVPAQIV